MEWQRGDVAMIDYESMGRTRRVVAHRLHTFGDEEPWMVNIWGFLKVDDSYIDAHNPEKMVAVHPIMTRDEWGELKSLNEFIELLGVSELTDDQWERWKELNDKLRESKKV